MTIRSNNSNYTKYKQMKKLLDYNKRMKILMFNIKNKHRTKNINF